MTGVQTCALPILVHSAGGGVVSLRLSEGGQGKTEREGTTEREGEREREREREGERKVGSRRQFLVSMVSLQSSG